MKKVLFGLLMICMISCSKEETPRSDMFSLRVENSLDIQLDNVVVAGLYFGTIDAGETTEYIVLEELSQEHFRALSMNANIEKSVYYSQGNYIICGTPPIPVYTYSKGAMTLKVTSVDFELKSLYVDQIEDEPVEIE